MSPADPRAENAPRVVLLTGDLLLRPRLEALIQAAGATAETRSSREAVDGLLAAAEPPGAVVVDLSATSFSPAEAISALKTRFPATPVLAFGPHTDRAALADALARGSLEALPRSRAVRELTQILRDALARA